MWNKDIKKWEVTDEDNNDYFNPDGVQYHHKDFNPDGTHMPICTKVYQWATKPLSLVDFAAVMPFVLDLFDLARHLNGFVSLRYLRLIRVFRVLKLQKQTIAVALFVNTIRTSAGPLMVLMFFVGMAIVVFGSIVYQVEHGSYCPPGAITKQWLSRGTMKDLVFVAGDGSKGNVWMSETANVLKNQVTKCVIEGKKVETCCDSGVLHKSGTKPVDGGGCFCRLDTMGDLAEKTPFFSVFVSMWWVLTTITTVGYGDTFPTTLMGRIIGAVAMILGVVGFAMPISIIGNAFEDEYVRLSTGGDGGPRVLDQALGIGAVSDEELQNGTLPNGAVAKSTVVLARVLARRHMGPDTVVVNGNSYVLARDIAQADSPGRGFEEDSQRVKIMIGDTTSAPRDPKDVMAVLADIARNLGVSQAEWQSSFQSNTV